MAEEEVVAAAASPVPSDHKRKLEDLEPDAPEPAESTHPEPADSNSNSVSDGVENAEVAVTDSSEAKRPRLESLDDKPDGLVTASENGYQAEKVDEPMEENAKQPSVENPHSEDTQDKSEEAQVTVNNEQPSTDDLETVDTQQPSIENPQLGDVEEPSGGEIQQPSVEISQQGDDYSAQQEPSSETQAMSRKMEVPNNKVGVLIGKAGDTIRYLQYNSGAKIQITRDVDADPYSATRPVELIGSLENINKAEKLIKDVIAEADAGGSPSLVARGFATAQATGPAEQIQIQVPNEKVGLIIGRGGETIKSLQTRSGARIQLIPQHLPEGDQSKERTVRVTGDKKQIEMAKELIKEVMDQPVRPSAPSSGYNHQQSYRPRGPTGPPQWGPRGHPVQPTTYDYPQRGPYTSQNPQYAAPTYGSYPQQQLAPRSSFASGWEQRPPATMQQGPPPQSGGYDYYGGQGADAPASAPHSTSIPVHGSAPAMGPPPSQANYNYGQPQGPDYGQPAPYSQTASSQQSYGHGYDEMKYENQQHSYGGHGSSQPVYNQAASQPGYAQQQQYGKQPSYGMPSQGPPPQSYGAPRASSQPGEMPYQGHVSSTQSYGQNVPSQQPYPYATSGPMHPQYGSQPAADGYNQPPPTSGPGYPQQGAQPVSGYSQPGGQLAPGYVQGYGQYPSTQPGYTEQPAPNNAGYGYQGPADPGYASGPGSAYGAPQSGQPGYAQPSYDQSVPQSGGYASLAGGAPVGYVKSLSPQPGYPQYDANQMYGAPR